MIGCHSYPCPENTNPKQNLEKNLGLIVGGKPPHKKGACSV